LFIDTFGDPATNPKGWPMVPLCSVATVGSGVGFPKDLQGSSGERYPFLKVSDMNPPGNEHYVQTWNNSVSEEVRVTLRATAFPKGSVIFPKIGAAIATNKKRVLTCASCIDNNVMAVTFGPDVITEFGFGLFQHKNISDFASASDPPSMRKSEVEQWRIPIPPLALQTAFAEQVQRLEALARLLDAAAAKAEAMAAALSAEIFG
jgi:Type I restriction modification DNA specificity domain